MSERSYSGVGVVAVDLQYYYFYRDHWLKGSVVAARNLISLARSRRIPVIYAKTHDENELAYADFYCPVMKPYKIIDCVKPEDEDLVIDKAKFSNFEESKIDEQLKEKNINKVVLTGGNGDVCVQDIFDYLNKKGYMGRIIIPSDAITYNSINHKTMEFTKTRHTRAIRYFLDNGATITDTKRILDLL